MWRWEETGRGQWKTGVSWENWEGWQVCRGHRQVESWVVVFFNSHFHLIPHYFWKSTTMRRPRKVLGRWEFCQICLGGLCCVCCFVCCTSPGVGKWKISCQMFFHKKKTAFNLEAHFSWLLMWIRSIHTSAFLFADSGSKRCHSWFSFMINHLVLNTFIIAFPFMGACFQLLDLHHEMMKAPA